MQDLINQYNALDGQIVTRAYLNNLTTKIFDAIYLDESTFGPLHKKLSSLLIDNPDHTHFKLTIANKIENTEVYDDAYFESLGIPYLTPKLAKDFEEENTGLNKAVTPADIYDYITQTVINTIEKVGELPWQREWKKTSLYNGFQALNYDTKKGYRGINYVMLNYEVKRDENGQPYLVNRDLSNPYFLTAKSIKRHGGRIKKGAKADRVVYFTKLYTYKGRFKNGEVAEYGTYDQKKFKKWIDKNYNQLDERFTKERLYNTYIPILKYYNVFNGAETEGIEFKDLPKNNNVDLPKKERIEIAENIVNSMPNKPDIKFGGDQPAYYPTTDHVLMTPIEAFNEEQSYYSTLFHELIHATGHRKRLARFGVTGGKDKTKQDYAFEELIAELGAVFLCAESGILFSTLENSAKYLRGWNSRLVKNMKKDNKYFFRASSKSQAAADYILDRNKEGKPAYLKIESTKKETSEIDTSKEVSKLSTDQLKKIHEIYLNDILWTEEVTKYVKKVRAELLKRQEKELDKKELNFELPETYQNDLDLRTTQNSYNGYSFSPGKRGKAEVERWKNWLSETYTELKELAVQNNYDLTELYTDFKKYHKSILKAKLDVISKRSRVLSTMITGPANFPVRKAQAASRAYDDSMDHLYKLSDKILNKIKAKIMPYKQIKSGDKDAVKSLKFRLKNLEYIRNVVKQFNKEYNKKDVSPIEKKDFIESHDIITKYLNAYPNKGKLLINARIKDAINGGKFVILYLSKDILDVKKRIDFEERRVKSLENAETEINFDKGKIVLNTDQNRLQVLFEDIPDEDLRKTLKKNGFRWSPKNKAWQRQLTNAAISSAKRIFNVDITWLGTPLNGPQHKGIAKEALDNCSRLKPGYKFKKGGSIEKAKVSKKAIKQHLSNKSKTQLADDYAYIFSADLDRVEARILDSKTSYQKHLNDLTEKVFNNQEYLKTIGLSIQKKKDASKGLKISINPIQAVPNLVTNQQPTVQHTIEDKGFSSVAVPEVLNTPIKHQEQPKPKVNTTSTPKPSNNTIASKLKQQRTRQFFSLKPQFSDLHTFLGKVERPAKESVVLTLSGPQGCGKTTAIFDAMNAFATSGYNVLHASLEEHPDSYLYEQKAVKYLSPEAQQRIKAPAYSSSNKAQILKDIEEADVIVIDSMKKMWQYFKGFDLDNDLRKKYNGKLFIIIFQLTSDGKMRGGSDAQFDGDIITFIEKHENFNDNYIYHDKNRFAVVPIHLTKYNIASQSLVKPEEEAPVEAPKSLVFS